MEAPQHSALLDAVAATGRAVALIGQDEVAGRAEPAARRRRQIGLVRIGRHPISLYLRRAFSAGLLLHSQAPRQIDARPSPYRCGTCRFAARLAEPGRSEAAARLAGIPTVSGALLGTVGTPHRPSAERAWKCFRWPGKVTRGHATDIRLMWPACRNWLPKEDPGADPTPAADAG